MMFVDARSGRLKPSWCARFLGALLPGLIAAGAANAAGLADHVCTTAVPPTTPSSDFEVVGDVENGVVRHLSTGLEWRRCVLSSTFTDGECQGFGVFNWQGALQGAEAEGDGWRVPNFKELASIIEECSFQPAINTVVFPLSNATLWTSTTDNRFGTDRAKVIDIESGLDSSNLKLGRNSDRRATLLVRNPR